MSPTCSSNFSTNPLLLDLHLTTMTFTRLVTKCIAILSPDNDHLPLDHCTVCRQPTCRFYQAQLHATSKSSSASGRKKQCCTKLQEPKEAKFKKTTANWKLNCAKLISGAMSTCSSSSSPSPSNPTMHCPEPASTNHTSTSTTTFGSAQFQLHDNISVSAHHSPSSQHTDLQAPPSMKTTSAEPLSITEDPNNEDCDETARIQRLHEIARGVEPPPGYLPMLDVRDSKNPRTTYTHGCCDTAKPLLGSMPSEIVKLDTTNTSSHASSQIGEEAMRRLLPHLAITETNDHKLHQRQPIHSQVINISHFHQNHIIQITCIF